MNFREQRQRDKTDAAAAISAWICARLPAADLDAVTQGLNALKLTPEHTARVLAHLHTHPDALTSGDSAGPTGVRRLLDTLAVDHPEVHRARCGRCGDSNRPLPYRSEGDDSSICARCYFRLHRITCIRCGQSGPPAHREDGGTVCARCARKDPTRHRPCSKCAKVTLVAYRVDGRPLCQNCGPKPRHTCAECGRTDQLAKAVTEHGPICSSCYHRSRQHQCHQCSRVTSYARRDGSLWICNRCRIPPTATCFVCGITKPCGKGRTLGRPICSTCRSRTRPHKPCTECGVTRRVLAILPTGPICAPCHAACTPKPSCARCGALRDTRITLPIGSICAPCFYAVRDNPSPCARCGLRRPLVGTNTDGDSVCGPCCGDHRLWNCRTCNGFDLLVNDTCHTCTTTGQLDAVLAGPDGAVHPQLIALRTLMLALYTPTQIEHRCKHSKWTYLLRDLAADHRDITHAHLDAMPQDNHVRLLRHVLVDTGALSARSKLTDAVDPWLRHFLADQPPDAAALLRPYAAWSVLRRARHRADRGLDSPSTPKYVRARIAVAAQFIAWLATRDTEPWAATQADVDLWLSQGATTRHRIRDFLHWAYANGHSNDLAVTPLGRRGLATHVLAEDSRWALLRRCLHDDTVALELRVAGALVLLYGYIPSRIVELTRNDLTANKSGVYLTLAAHPVLLPPALAQLVTRFAEQHPRPRELDRSPWLFPGARRGTHRDSGNLTKRLNTELGIFVRPARGAALCDLAADLPSPVLADLLGVSASAAARWTALAARDWTTYIARRTHSDTAPDDDDKSWGTRR